MKGVVLVNCGELGLSWERTSLSMYLEACAARDPEAPKADPVSDEGLRRFMAAHQSVQ